MNDLPELPFELILSHLSLEDRLRLRRVSRWLLHVISSSRPTTLCYSDRPRGFIQTNRRIISGAFAQNFISSRRISSFFQTFGQSILSSLKHLRFCEIHLNPENIPAFFQTINSFDQLEELGLYHIDSVERDGDYQLNLPMLKSVSFDEVHAIKKLTLNSPRLRKIELRNCDLNLGLVHGESVEKLVIDYLHQTKVWKLVNLQTLYCASYAIHSTVLSALRQLKEIHLNHRDYAILNIFEQKRQYGRSELKVYLSGCLLKGPNDPAIGSLDYPHKGYLVFLTENQSRLAEEIPYFYQFFYSEIRAMSSVLEIDLLNRFPDLKCICVDERVQDVDGFLQLLKSLDNIHILEFRGHQPRELFDRLPDHSAIQSISIEKSPIDLNFLFGLKSLIQLDLKFQIDIELISKVLKELPFLSSFHFECLKKYCIIKMEDLNQFRVSLGAVKKTIVSDANAAIQWITDSVLESDEESDDE